MLGKRSRLLELDDTMNGQKCERRHLAPGDDLIEGGDRCYRDAIARFEIIANGETVAVMKLCGTCAEDLRDREELDDVRRGTMI